MEEQVANQAANIILGTFGLVALFIIACIFIIVAIEWKLFKKAGKPGWAALVPVYNYIILLEIVGFKWYYVFVFFASAIPVVGGVITILFSIVMNIKLAKSFGKDTAFGIGLCFLSPVFTAILAFNKEISYVGPAVNGDIDFNNLF